jgi:membrane associated rhomboid family serine protease
MTLTGADFVVGKLGFSREALVAGHWWSLLTYPFVHGGLLHLGLNLYALAAFGPRVEQAWGTRRLLSVMAGCAAAGVLLHAMFVSPATPLIGASAAVFGIMTAYAMQWPDDELYLLGVLPIRVWTMVILLMGATLLVGVLTTLGAGGGIAYFAHLGGALAGWMYLRTPGSTPLEHPRHRVSRVPDVEEPPRAIPRQQPRAKERMEEVDEIVARSKAISAKRPNVPAAPAAPQRPPPADELDRVLDKISAEGLESLTNDERRALEEMAKRLRDS